jgi:hypothetical protein
MIYVSSLIKQTKWITFLFLTISCGPHNDLDKNAIIKQQTIDSNDIIVYNVNPDLTKGEGFHSSYNIILGLQQTGISFEPTEWNSKMVFAYGTVKNKINKGDKIFYDFNGYFMRSKYPNAAVTKEYGCYLTAEVDTVQKICDVTILLDIDSLIFELKYK